MQVPKINNPLTVVAVFSALAESFAIFSLVKLPPEIQAIFIYFVMFFPVALLVLFFATLNWNHTVLYAPGDFEDEGMYVEILRLKNEQIRNVVETTIQTAVDATSLTEDEKTKVSQSVNTAVARATSDSRKESILAFIGAEEKAPTDIAEELGISPIYTYRLLAELLSEQRVKQRKAGRNTFWSLAGAAPSDVN